MRRMITRLYLFAILATACGTPKPATCPTCPTCQAAPTTPPAPPAKVIRDHGNASVISLIVKMTIKPEFEEEFLAESRILEAKIHETEPGTVLHALAKHPSEPHTYIVIERYANQEALDAHGKTPHMQRVWPMIPKWLAKPSEVLKVRQINPP
jgi:quinol monooxygenase YgiN